MKQTRNIRYFYKVVQLMQTILVNVSYTHVMENIHPLLLRSINKQKHSWKKIEIFY
jgi:hypothetical protein